MNIMQPQYSLKNHLVGQRVESAPLPATILLVDDDDSLRDVAGTILRKRGYTVLEAKDGSACLKIAQEYPAPIHFLLTDMFMPGMNGREVSDHLATLRNRTRVLYMSGQSNEAILTHCGLYSGVVFVHKPFNPEILLRKVSEALGT